MPHLTTREFNQKEKAEAVTQPEPLVGLATPHEAAEAEDADSELRLAYAKVASLINGSSDPTDPITKSALAQLTKSFNNAARARRRTSDARS